VVKTGHIVAAVAIAVAVMGSASACAPDRSSLAGPGTSKPTHSSTPPAPTATATPTPTPTPTPTGFNKHALSIDDPNSIWVVVNKLRPLNPRSYGPPDIINVPVAHDNPPQMRKVAGDALVQMFAAGKAAGAGGMQIQSAWRPYSTQVRVYAGWVKSLGQAQADRQSARPGYSEHQTGLAVDISPVPLKCALAACFGTTPQGRWLAANAYRFGFLLRYPADKTAVTGYEYEPWHFRYIGVALATEMHSEHVETLEEFFGLPAAPDYAK
jgi:D-alanyl-D-alanine carboxypeptidase